MSAVEIYHHVETSVEKIYHYIKMYVEEISLHIDMSIAGNLTSYINRKHNIILKCL